MPKKQRNKINKKLLKRFRHLKGCTQQMVTHQEQHTFCYINRLKIYTAGSNWTLNFGQCVRSSWLRNHFVEIIGNPSISLHHSVAYVNKTWVIIFLPCNGNILHRRKDEVLKAENSYCLRIDCLMQFMHRTNCKLGIFKEHKYSNKNMLNLIWTR